MIVCPFSKCHSSHNSDEQSFKIHLRLFHRNRTGEIVCRVCDQAAFFSSYSNWKRHMNDHHNGIITNRPPTPPHIPPSFSDMEDIDMDDGDNERDDSCDIDIDPRSLSTDSDDSPVSFDELAHSLLSSLLSKLDGLPGISHSSKDELFFTIHTLLNLCSEFSPSLSMIDSLMSSFMTKYMRQKKTVSDGLILPQPLHLGVEQVQRRDKDGRVETVNLNSNAYIVPVEASIRQLLSDPVVFDTLSTPTPFNQHMIESFLDGSIGHSLTQEAESLGCIPLPLTMFEDDAAAGNKNGGVSLRYMFYTIASLPLHLRSSHRCKLLFAVANAKEMKRYGETLLQRKWIEEMGGMNEPIEMEVNGRSVKFLVRFREITGDNKALNALAGYRQCFSSGKFCRDCEVDYGELETSIQLSSLQLRTINSYEAAIGQLGTRKECAGIRSSCVLNDLPGFHVIFNIPHDLMHDGLEGIARIEMRKVVRSLSHEGVILNQINERIKYFAYGRTDRYNKPEQIALTQVSLGQRAYQSLTLLRLLPWILRRLGDLPPSFLSANRLIALLLSPSFSRNRDIDLITEYAESYLQDCLSNEMEEEEENGRDENQFRRTSIIKPKQHFLLHYASAVRKSGPPRLHWSMTYESILSFAKRVSYSSHNYSNLPLTIANAYQRHLHHLRSRPYEEITPIRSISHTSFHGLNYRGYEIRRNDFLTISIDIQPSFGRVIEFTRDGLAWSVTLRQYVTEELMEKYSGYKIIETTGEVSIPLRSIYSMQPLDGYETDESDVIAVFPIHSLRQSNGTSRLEMLTIRRVDRGFVNEIFHGISPLRYGILADICEYIATRQHVSMDRITCEDTYSGIQVGMEEEIDEMRGYTWTINEKECANQNEMEIGQTESTFHEMKNVKQERSIFYHNEFTKNDFIAKDPDLQLDDNGNRQCGEDEERLGEESIENEIDVVGDSDSETMIRTDQRSMGTMETHSKKLTKRSLPATTTIALSGFALKVELGSAQMSKILGDEKGGESILREISQGSTLETTPVRRALLMRSVANFLLKYCRNTYNPTYIEKLSFVSKLFQPYPQFDPVSLCQSGGSISKSISYSRRVLAETQNLKKRNYRKQERDVDSLERQKDLLVDIASTPIGSEGYRSIVNLTRKYRSILMSSMEFRELLSGYPYLIVESSIVIGDLETKDGSFTVKKFEADWRSHYLPNLLKISEQETDLRMESLRGDCGGSEDGVACAVLLWIVNRTIAGSQFKGKLSNFYSHFPSNTTQSEALESLRAAKIPYPSIFRIGCQTTLLVYLGDVCAPIPNLSFPLAITYIVSIVSTTKLTFPRTLSRFYNFFKVLMALNGAKLHDSLFAVYNSLRFSD